MNTSQHNPGHSRCGARRRDGSGEPCGLPAGWGTDHVGTGRCRKHLGTSPSHEASARQAMAEEAVRKFGLPVKTTASQALQDELERSAGAITFLLAKVRSLPEDSWLWNAQKITDSERGDGVRNTIRTGIHPWVRLLNEERRHFAEVARVMCSLDIDARRVSVAEEFGGQIAAVLRRAVLGADLAPDDQAKVIAMLPRELRAISAGQGDDRGR